MAVINPFVVGGYVSPRYFCDRVAETENLIRNLIKWEKCGSCFNSPNGKNGIDKALFLSAFD